MDTNLSKELTKKSARYYVTRGSIVEVQCYQPEKQKKCMENKRPEKAILTTLYCILYLISRPLSTIA